MNPVRFAPNIVGPMIPDPAVMNSGSVTGTADRGTGSGTDKCTTRSERLQSRMAAPQVTVAAAGHSGD